MDDAKKKSGPPDSLSRKETKANKRNTNKKRRQKERKTLKDLNEKATSKSQQRFMGMVAAGKIKAPKGLSKEEARDFAKTKHKDLPEKVAETESNFHNEFNKTFKSISFKQFLSINEELSDPSQNADGLAKLKNLVGQIVGMMRKDPTLGKSSIIKPQQQQDPQQQQQQKEPLVYPALDRIPEGLLGSVTNSSLNTAQSALSSTKHGGQAARVANTLASGFGKAVTGITDKKQQKKTSAVPQAAQIAYEVRALAKSLGKTGMQSLNNMLTALSQSEPDVGERTKNFILGA